MLKKILVTPLIQIALVTALILAGMFSSLCPWAALENKHYDFWAHRFHNPENQPISIVAIDDKSVHQIGDWPWPRTRIAEMVQWLSGQGAAAMGICLLYTQPEQNPGLQEIRHLQDQIADQGWQGEKKTTRQIVGLLSETEARLDSDAFLIEAIRKAKNAVLPIHFTSQHPTEKNNGKPSGVLIINSLNAAALPKAATDTSLVMARAIGGGHRSPVTAEGVRETYGSLAAKAGALGHLNLQEDPDGVVRSVPLLINYLGRLYPAFSLQLVRKHIGAQLQDLIFELDFFGQPSLRIAHLQLPTDGAYRMLINHDSQWIRERTYSFTDVIDGAIDPTIFKDKIVLIGVTAEGLTPWSRAGRNGRAGTGEINAGLLANLLSTLRLSQPSWALALEIAALLYFAVFLAFVIPRVNVRVGAAILIIFLATWYALVVGLLLGYGYWVKVLGPVLLACAGFVLIQATSFSSKWQQERLGANKTLGLSYQGQGMLDMALEKYMQCPVRDASVKHLLYNLALDFERKRMFNKALAVYQHIRTAGVFKDIDKRSQRLKSVDSTIPLTGVGGKGETTLMMEDTGTKPTFGRYQIIRELGRGAMGTVYLGRDPRINRRVAIKTLEYQEVDISELGEVKKRFFREAEAAGKLSHPNIVSIYDVGEEHDMAYIAMELLKGEELIRYCTPENLLTLPRAVDIISDVTSALDYAHGQGVVHRDIKPANIMLLEDGRVKVTDFGIARVADASKTRTGIILGTPNYMSPEQVAGKNVDGRSDLFSLGIVFYELLAGVKPFKGDTITAVMYAITHHAHTPLLEVAPQVPACYERIVNKLLAKGVTTRFSSAAQVAKAIEAC